MLFVMHECQPYGHMANEGRRIPDESISNLVRIHFKIFRRVLDELEKNGVFSRTKDGTIYSRRMVRDESVRAARAAGGKLGGNPALMVKHNVNLTDNHVANLKPTPSFAVAFSSSIPSVRSEQNPGIEDSRTRPPQGFFEKLKTDIPTLAKLPTEPDPEPEAPNPAPARRINGHAVKPLAALTKGNWKANQVSIAAVAAQLEFRPQAGETFAQLAERCQREITRRRKEAAP